MDDRNPGSFPGAAPGGGGDRAQVPAGAAFSDDEPFDLGGDDDLYEWVGGEETDRDGRPQPPRRSPRELLAALRALRIDRRQARRAGVAGGVLLLTAALATGATAWFDAVARGADEAQVTSLSLDAVLDGDPAATKLDPGTAAGTAEYIVEIANNGPAAVTLTGLAVDAGTMMTSTGWRPIGSPRIPGGGIGRARLTVRQNCNLLMLGMSAGRGAFSFPNITVSVRAANGDVRTRTLTARQQAPEAVPDLGPGGSGSVNQGGSGFGGPFGGTAQLTTAPQVAMTDSGSCMALVLDALDRTRTVGDAPDTGDPALADESGPVQLIYAGVKTPATPAAPNSLGLAQYTLDFRARNVGDVAVRLQPSSAGTDVTAVSVLIPVHGEVDFPVTVAVGTCSDRFLTGAAGTYLLVIPDLDMTHMTRDATHFGTLSSLLSGSQIKVTLDELAQRKAACP